MTDRFIQDHESPRLWPSSVSCTSLFRRFVSFRFRLRSKRHASSPRIPYESTSQPEGLYSNIWPSGMLKSDPGSLLLTTPAQLLSPKTRQADERQRPQQRAMTQPCVCRRGGHCIVHGKCRPSRGDRLSESAHPRLNCYASLSDLRRRAPISATRRNHRSSQSLRTRSRPTRSWTTLPTTSPTCRLCPRPLLHHLATTATACVEQSCRRSQT